MYQKRRRIRATAFLLILAMFISVIPVWNNVDAAEIKETEIGVVDDITSSNLTRGTESNSLDTIFSFTLKKPGIVRASAAQTISSDEFYFMAGVYADSKGTALVQNGELRVTSGSGTYWVKVGPDGAERTMWLEAGTYYIIIKPTRKIDPKSINENGKVSVGVCCEYVDRTCSGNNSFQKAGKIKLNDDVTGFLSHTNRKQYYKFVLSKPSSVEISSVASTSDLVQNTTYSYSSSKSYKLFLCNSKYKEITGKETECDGSSEIINAKLNKGTYYIVLDASKYDKFIGANTLKVNAKALPKPATPKVKKATANTNTVKGTAVKGSIVYVSYNGKTYKATVSKNGSYTVKTSKLKKGKSVKIYAVKNYVKSNVRTVKVK